jgi:glycosyltransferase involved in cell wall biosynthesis
MSPERKGTENILRALPALAGPFRLVIHSQVKLKQQYPQYEALIDEYERSGVLELIEKSVTAPGLYHLGDVYVYPTILEGIGLTILEALSSGLPVITSDNSPMNEFVDNDNGKLLEVDRLYARSDGYYWPLCRVNIEALARAMQHYIDRASDIEIFKTRARNYAEKYLDWTQREASVCRVFEEALSINTEERSEIAKEIERYEKRYRNNVGYYLNRLSPLLYRFYVSSTRRLRQSE